MPSAAPRDGDPRAGGRRLAAAGGDRLAEQARDPRRPAGRGQRWQGQLRAEDDRLLELLLPQSEQCHGRGDRRTAAGQPAGGNSYQISARFPSKTQKHTENGESEEFAPAFGVKPQQWSHDISGLGHANILHPVRVRYLVIRGDHAR